MRRRYGERDGAPSCQRGDFCWVGRSASLRGGRRLAAQGARLPRARCASWGERTGGCEDEDTAGLALDDGGRWHGERDRKNTRLHLNDSPTPKEHLGFSSAPALVPVTSRDGPDAPSPSSLALHSAPNSSASFHWEITAYNLNSQTHSPKRPPPPTNDRLPRLQPSF